MRWLYLLLAIIVLLPLTSALCTNSYTYNISQQKCLNATDGDPKDPVGDNSMIFFSFLFILLLGTMAYIIIHSVGHAVTLDFDMKDLAMNYGLYFAIIAFYGLEVLYFGDLLIANFLDWIIYIGAVTQIFLPTIYFILTLTVGNWMKLKFKESGGEEGWSSGM
jgi:hypothetical protein